MQITPAQPLYSAVPYKHIPALLGAPGTSPIPAAPAACRLHTHMPPHQPNNTSACNTAQFYLCNHNLFPFFISVCFRHPGKGRESQQELTLSSSLARTCIQLTLTRIPGSAFEAGGELLAQYVQCRTCNRHHTFVLLLHSHAASLLVPQFCENLSRKKKKKNPILLFQVMKKKSTNVARMQDSDTRNPRLFFL